MASRVAWGLIVAAITAAGCVTGSAPSPAPSPRVSLGSRPAAEHEAGDGRGCLRLTISGPDGTSVPGKMVMLRFLSGLESVAQGNPDKQARFELVPGDWEVDIQASHGHSPAIFALPIREGECTLASVTLHATPSWRHIAVPPRPGFGIVEGRVVADGERLSGKQVAWAALPGWTPNGIGFTDADGRYRLHLRPGRYDVRFDGPTFDPLGHGVLPSAGDDSTEINVVAGHVVVHDLTLRRSRERRAMPRDRRSRRRLRASRVAGP